MEVLETRELNNPNYMSGILESPLHVAVFAVIVYIVWYKPLTECLF